MEYYTQIVLFYPLGSHLSPFGSSMDPLITPSGNAIRVVNKEQLEFPLTVVAEPYAFEEETAELDWHN